ncbi:helix-turn-helix domain-containing protein [Streptomyces sp. NPDC048590]|uniref:helix-turn-helix domain-containing protein n=1 Tax=Streptomyces sp. NPDC048590 TaxID=3365574 RepID=UPI0037193B68
MRAKRSSSCLANLWRNWRKSSSSSPDSGSSCLSWRTRSHYRSETVWVLGRWWCVRDLVGDARHLSPSAREALRLRAVAALVAGRAREDVAAVFGVSLKAVDGWWAKWQAGGREALVMQQAGQAGRGAPGARGGRAGCRAAGGPRSPALRRGLEWAVVNATAGG